MIFKSYLVENDISILKDKNIILIYGENTGLKDDLKKSIIERNKNKEVIKFTQDEILRDNSLLNNEIINLSLFNDKKIIIINNITDKSLSLIETIINQDNCIICLFSGSLEKKSKLRKLFEKEKKLGLIACYEDNEITLRNYIKKYLKN